MLPSIIAALTGLIGAFGGAYLSNFIQRKRETDAHWRDSRLEVYSEFLSVHRTYVAYLNDPSSEVIASQHPRFPGELVTTFVGGGRAIQERHEVAFTKVRLVADNPETVYKVIRLVTAARLVAGERASCEPKDIAAALFVSLFDCEQDFINACRVELALPELDRDGLGGRDHGRLSLLGPRGASPSSD